LESALDDDLARAGVSPILISRALPDERQAQCRQRQGQLRELERMVSSKLARESPGHRQEEIAE
jgi:hypothetical protein